ncbi:MAG: amidohydrolase family protein [Gammaproteobacteria bacterium]|nr:amidohydrolase family protein [Gammaproteobacteria bacterium]
MNSREIRSNLPHPIIDSDAHWLEFGPVLHQRIEKIAGRKVAELFDGLDSTLGTAQRMGPEERRRRRVAHSGFWQVPMANTRDRATAMMPKLLYERLDELGLDYCVMYPTGGGAIKTDDDALRLDAVRAFNRFCAEWFADYSDRLTPVAVIPMKTPDEAIAELEYVTGELGMKAALFGAMIPREVPAVADGDADANKLGLWYDVLGLDSIYDYDPVWAKCVELGIPPTFHASGRGYVLRRSPSNFTYNHIGHFASTGEAICKALFLGGVTRRFPDLNIAFLEGGSSYACQLYADLIGHWNIRNPEALKNVDPDNLDHELLIELAKQYGPEDMAALLTDRKAAQYAAMTPEVSLATGGEANLDDFAACKIEKKEDFRELFGRFYFGCEADDRMNAWAFDERANPLGTKLNALFSSDIGHFDVEQMNEVLEEAFELVEEGVMSAGDFRAFTFTNPAHFWADGNPDFFKGTVVETQVAELLRGERAQERAPHAAGS